MVDHRGLLSIPGDRGGFVRWYFVPDLSVIWVVLNSETYLVHRISYKWVWTCSIVSGRRVKWAGRAGESLWERTVRKTRRTGLGKKEPGGGNNGKGLVTPLTPFLGPLPACALCAVLNACAFTFPRNGDASGFKRGLKWLILTHRGPLGLHTSSGLLKKSRVFAPAGRGAATTHWGWSPTRLASESHLILPQGREENSAFKGFMGQISWRGPGVVLSIRRVYKGTNSLQWAGLVYKIKLPSVRCAHVLSASTGLTNTQKMCQGLGTQQQMTQEWGPFWSWPVLGRGDSKEVTFEPRPEAERHSCLGKVWSQ